MVERNQALQIVTFAAYTTTNRDLLIPDPQHGAVILNTTLRQPQIFIFNPIAELNAWESFLHYYNASAEPAANAVPVWNATNKRWELTSLALAHEILSATHTNTNVSPSIALGQIMQVDTGLLWQAQARPTVAANFKEYWGFSNGATRGAYHALFDDGADPESIAAAAATGSDVEVARRDHVHPHPASQHAAGGAMALFSPHTYVFPSDSDLDADVAVGDQQGGFNHHSYDSAETVKRIITEFETAPTGADAIIQLEYADSDDWDDPDSFTEIDIITHPAGQKTVVTTGGFTNASIPGNRRIRQNVDQVGSTVAGKNLTTHLQVLRPLVTG